MNANPLTVIPNTRQIDSVWIAGRRVAGVNSLLWKSAKRSSFLLPLSPRFFRVGDEGPPVNQLQIRQAQNVSFSANWTWRELVAVRVMTPAEVLILAPE